MSKNVKITRFDISKITNDSTVLCLGKRRSGKSWLVRDIMYHNRHTPSGVVFSSTKMNGFFNTFIPDTFVHDTVDESILSKIIKKQMQKSEIGGTPSTKFLILDDVIHDTGWTRNNSIKNILFNGRHLKIFFILTSQYLNSIPPNLMTNFDYVFIFKEKNVKNLKKLYDNFGSDFEDFKEFKQIFQACTKDHNCMVVKTNGDSLSESIFYYTAKERRNFDVGNEQYRSYYRRNNNREINLVV